LHLKRLSDNAGLPTTKPRDSAPQEITKEAAFGRIGDEYVRALYRFAEANAILKAPPGVFLKEHVKWNDERLWDTFEFFERQRCVLMLHVERCTLNAAR
jgi:hypothetical protein